MHPIQQLEQLAAEFRHLQAEHERKQIESRARRREEGWLKETEEHFHRVLGHWVSSGDERDAWTAHFYRGAAPPEPIPGDAPLFKGRSSETGSVVEVRPRSDGQKDVVVDGTPMETLPANYELTSSIRVGAASFDETFEATQAALDALLSWVNDPSTDIPWQYARDLFEDGLIDENWGLTPRGHRFARRALAA